MKKPKRGKGKNRILSLCEALKNPCDKPYNCDLPISVSTFKGKNAKGSLVFQVSATSGYLDVLNLYPAQDLSTLWSNNSVDLSYIILDENSAFFLA